LESHLHKHYHNALLVMLYSTSSIGLQYIVRYEKFSICILVKYY